MSTVVITLLPILGASRTEFSVLFVVVFAALTLAEVRRFADLRVVGSTLSGFIKILPVLDFGGGRF